MSDFASLALPPPIAAAIERRGYASATSVQAAVLDPALEGRDLLVSSQTGSGKTLAFGALVGAMLYGAEKPAARAGSAPAALVIAPTRELAAQVSRELAWLLADTRARIGAFTGGTDVRGDLRTLRTGVDVAVGTPGRLVDLLTRKSLDLAAVRVAVLDEADEMLDLGFKEDLEALLAATPTERRTLLFSATLPSEVARLARSFQRDAARVDVRATDADGAHADIEYVAHLVRGEDRFAALVNVLLAAGQSKAIIFCRTREAVGRVHQRLTDHGFRAVAMAGDRAQGERDRALESVRGGQARILVATNVAARGIDLPDVELVVHADLPENSEALTHRSGRTGRAGRKGTSVVFADPAERRKAERLMANARVRARWTPAPTEGEAHKVGLDLLAKELREEAKAVRGGEAEAGAATALRALADELGAALPERVLLHVLLARAASGLPVALPLEPIAAVPPPRAASRPTAGAPYASRSPSTAGAPYASRSPSTAGAPYASRSPSTAGSPYASKSPPSAGSPFASRSPSATGPSAASRRGEPSTPWRIFRVNLGSETGAEPRSVLPVLCRRGGVTRQEIGSIRIGRTSTTFEVVAGAAEAYSRAARRPDPSEPDVRIEEVAPPAPRARPPGKAPAFRAPRPVEAKPRKDARPTGGARPPRPTKRP